MKKLIAVTILALSIFTAAANAAKVVLPSGLCVDTNSMLVIPC